MMEPIDTALSPSDIDLKCDELRELVDSQPWWSTRRRVWNDVVTSASLSGTLAQNGDKVQQSMLASAARRVPLGRYFESLIAHALTIHPDVEALHQNIQIHRASTTLGELDFVFLWRGQWHHWEVAIKFYLGKGNSRLKSNWLGPQARDRWDRKHQRMIEHQLPLASSPEAIAVFDKLGIGQVRSNAMVFGVLFHTIERYCCHDDVVPNEVSRNHRRGFWLTLPNIHLLTDLQPSSWYVVPKSEWIGSLNSGRCLQPPDIEEWCSTALSDGSSPPMVAAFDRDGRELHRGFVVPASWPQVPPRS